MKKSTCNLGIFMASDVGDVEVPYYGTILDILDVHFGSFTTTVLEVRWHKSIMSPPARATMVMDECGFYRVDTTRVAPSRTELSDT